MILYNQIDVNLNIKEFSLNKTPLDELNVIAKENHIKDINLIKPGIGESTRVLLRRVPNKILVHSLTDNQNLKHIYRLAQEKNVQVIEYPLCNYRACGIIKELGDI